MYPILTAIILLINAFFFSPAKPKPEKWISLFDGKTTKGWHSYKETKAGDAWKVEDGTLHLDAAAKKANPALKGGDLVTDASFENFHLKLEWRISPKGNSGIIFFVQDNPAKFDNVWFTGPEMQVLDTDGHNDGKIYKHKAGDLYDLIAASSIVTKPVGEWNLAEIIADHGKLHFKLNGIDIVSTTYGDDNWKSLIAGSKFKDMPDFGKVFSGHVSLQDHGDDVWYRNIVIKNL